jgi:hypothetical protein
LIDRRKAKDAANNSGQRYPYTNLPQASAWISIQSQKTVFWPTSFIDLLAGRTFKTCSLNLYHHYQKIRHYFYVNCQWYLTFVVKIEYHTTMGSLKDGRAPARPIQDIISTVVKALACYDEHFTMKNLITTHMLCRLRSAVTVPHLTAATCLRRSWQHLNEHRHP